MTRGREILMVFALLVNMGALVWAGAHTQRRLEEAERAVEISLERARETVTWEERIYRTEETLDHLEAAGPQAEAAVRQWWFAAGGVWLVLWLVGLGFWFGSRRDDALLAEEEAIFSLHARRALALSERREEMLAERAEWARNGYPL